MNLASLLVLSVIILLVVWIIYRMIVRRNRTASSCHDECQGCALAEKCRSRQK